MKAARLRRVWSSRRDSTRFLAGALARKHLLPHGHGAFLAITRIAVADVHLQMLEGFASVSDVLDFRLGKRAAFEVLGAVHRGVAGRDAAG